MTNTRVINANAIRSREKRIALQILFSSRAIDSLLAHIVRNDHIRRGEVPERYYVLESSLGHLNGRGLLHGATLGQITYDKLCREVKDKRNKYLHQAGVFPSDAELARFLSATVDGIRRVSQL